MDNLKFLAKYLNCTKMDYLFETIYKREFEERRGSNYNKIKFRLSRWKGKSLSMTGRICLVKSVISVLPLFYLSFYKVPTYMCQTIRKYKQDLCGGRALKVQKLPG